jgi:hypothetical protein
MNSNPFIFGNLSKSNKRAPQSPLEELNVKIPRFNNLDSTSKSSLEESNSPTWETKRKYNDYTRNWLFKLFWNTESPRQNYLNNRFHLELYEDLSFSIIKSATNSKDSDDSILIFNDIVPPLGLIPLDCNNIWRQIELKTVDNITTLHVLEMENKTNTKQFKVPFENIILPFINSTKYQCYIFIDNFENFNRNQMIYIKKSLGQKAGGICYINTSLNFLRHIVLTMNIDLNDVYTEEIITRYNHIPLIFNTLFDGDDNEYKKLLYLLNEKHKGDTYGPNDGIQHFSFDGGDTFTTILKILTLTNLDILLDEDFKLKNIQDNPELINQASSLVDEEEEEFELVSGQLHVEGHAIYYNKEFNYIANDEQKIPIVKLLPLKLGLVLFRNTKLKNVSVVKQFSNLFYNDKAHNCRNPSPFININFYGSSKNVSFQPSDEYDELQTVFPFFEILFRRVPYTIYDIFANKLTVRIKANGENGRPFYLCGMYENLPLLGSRYNVFDQNELSLQDISQQLNYLFIKYDSNVPLSILILREACLLSHFYQNNMTLSVYEIWKDGIEFNLEIFKSVNDTILFYKMKDTILFYDNLSNDDNLIYIGVLLSDKVLYLENNNTLVTRDPDQYIPAFPRNRLSFLNAKYVYTRLNFQ